METVSSSVCTCAFSLVCNLKKFLKKKGGKEKIEGVKADEIFSLLSLTKVSVKRFFPPFFSPGLVMKHSCLKEPGLESL